MENFMIGKTVRNVNTGEILTIKDIDYEQTTPGVVYILSDDTRWNSSSMRESWEVVE